MTLFRKVVLGIGGVIALLAVIGLLLPRYVHIERAISIKAPQATVFTVINSFTYFNKWSPWFQLDPNAKYTFEGPRSGVGARMSWVGDPATMGNGGQSIITSEPWSRVQTDIDFGPQGKAIGTHTITTDGGETRVVWGFNTDLGLNPVSRYLGLMFDTMIGRDYERGLQGLKTFVETLPKADFGTVKIGTETAVQQPALGIPLSVPRDDAALEAALTKAFATISAFMQANDLAAASSPVCLDVKSTATTYDVMAAIPLKVAPLKVPAHPSIRLTRTYEGKVLTVTHVGPHRHLPVTMDKIAAYLAADGLQQAGPSWVEWVDDPASVPETDLRTIIRMPTK
jgi:effector-binding domain-containing protein